MFLRITKAVPSEGLKEGDIVRFQSAAEAAAHVDAEHGVEVTQAMEKGEDGVLRHVEHTFVDAEGNAFVSPAAKKE